MVLVRVLQRGRAPVLRLPLEGVFAAGNSTWVAVVVQLALLLLRTVEVVGGVAAELNLQVGLVVGEVVDLLVGELNGALRHVFLDYVVLMILTNVMEDLACVVDLVREFQEGMYLLILEDDLLLLLFNFLFELDPHVVLLFCCGAD